MPNVDLQPIAKSDASMLTYLDINFRRIADTLAALTNVEQGTLEVTGSVQIDTGMAEVINAYASFAGAPSADAAYVQIFPRGASFPKEIEIKVFTSSFAASTTPVDIAWYALGV